MFLTVFEGDLYGQIKHTGDFNKIVLAAGHHNFSPSLFLIKTDKGQKYFSET
ncbi:hypothetical protein A1Q_4085 [Vibrio campbellii HY01]|nr:hypothetical protein A1Q_4085 [Vibrio campbellii HY01]EKM23935.1 hypothetical protein VCHENC03_1820 [Vibrio sp. HENC-03]